LSWSSTQPSRVGSRECSFAKGATNPNGSPVGWICCDCSRVRQRSPKCGSGPSPRTTPRVTTSTPAAKGTGSSGATNRAGPPYHRLPSEAAPRTRHRSAGGKGLAYNHGDTNRLRCPSRPRRWLGRNTWPRCRLADCRPAQPPVAISCLAHRLVGLDCALLASGRDSRDQPGGTYGTESHPEPACRPAPDRTGTDVPSLSYN
jgi:hypothetical protein